MWVIVISWEVTESELGGGAALDTGVKEQTEGRAAAALGSVIDVLV